MELIKPIVTTRTFFTLKVLICAMAAMVSMPAIKLNAQVKKVPAAIAAKKLPAVGRALDCMDYFPVKGGTEFRFLKTARSVKNKSIVAYENTLTYYAAKARVINGKTYSSFLKDERLERIGEQDASGFGLFNVTSTHRTDRIFLGCTGYKTSDGTIITALEELQEILQQNSKVTGYYTVATETYRGNSIVPSSVTYDDVPETELERLGTGVYSYYFLYSSVRDNDYFLYRNQEIRKDRGEYEDLNPYEYRIYRFQQTVDTIEILGKTYTDILYFTDSVYSYDNGRSGKRSLLSCEEYYYAKGVGLIFKSKTEKRNIYTNAAEQTLSSLFSLGANDNSEIITLWELIPPDMTAEESRKMCLLGSFSEDKIRSRVDAVFSKNQDYQVK